MNELIEKAEALVVSLRENSDKFTEKGNKSAGTRTRKDAMEIKKLMSDIRNEVTNIKNA